MAKVKKEKVTTDDLKKVKKKKVVKLRDIRTMFREILSELTAAGGVAKIKKDWMSKKAFEIVDTPEALQKWIAEVLATAQRFEFYGVTEPVVALDTEDVSLDTRLFIRMVKLPDGSYHQEYEIKTDISGICLSADGVKGIYIPITHEFQDLALTTPARNIDRKVCAEILQPFFNQVHLVFYNGKFDREVMRLTMGIIFRPYPFFEDVQVLQYIDDPKADMEDKQFYTGDSGGLKALSSNLLGIEQIELEEIAKVKADTCPHTGSPFCSCTLEQKKENKHGLKQHFVPFSWIPVDIALYYAASDAICTWLLWEQLHPLARTRRTVHRIDHELVDSITWIERQRFLIDTDRHTRTVKGHQRVLAQFQKKLYDLAIAAGYKENATDDGVVVDKDRFNPDSNDNLRTLFFDVKGYAPLKMTDGGKSGIKKASCDAEVVEDLHKLHPEDEFLEVFSDYKSYISLHPSSLHYDPSDGTARIYLKQNVVAGGRLSSAGGDFYKDGGFGLNSQAVKKVEGYLMWKVTGNVLVPDEIPEDQIELHTPEELHPSCFRETEEEYIVEEHDEEVAAEPAGDWTDGKPHSTTKHVVTMGKRKVKKPAPGIIHNHIGQYMGYTVCLVPGCQTCKDKFGILIEGGKIDANQRVNLRCLFFSPPGWTFFTVDYGNIEMRAAANCLAGETKALVRDRGFTPLFLNVGPATLLNSQAEWVDAEIRSFGVQPLRRVVIGHNKWNAYIYATPDHHWKLVDGTDKTTDQLSHGDEIPFVKPSRQDAYPSSPDYLLGVRHGIIYGDGSRSLSGRKGTGARKGGVVACSRERGYRIRLCGEDKQLLSPYFDGYTVTYPASFKGDSLVQLFDEFTATHSLKELPDESETEAYLVGFFRGWLAADGHAGTSGISICCGPEEEEWLRRVMPRFGYYFLASSEIAVDTYFCNFCQAQTKTLKPINRPRLCKSCRSPIRIDAAVVLKMRRFQRRDYQAKKRSKCVTLFRPCMSSSDFLLTHKRRAFELSSFDLHETVRRVELTDRVEEVFCAVVPGTHDFVIENGLLTGNCSGEPEFINEFLHGKGDFHSLTASKVFPEFADPKSPNYHAKHLRDLAKIINFALLYGGTAYTIFENMRKQDPNITFHQCEEMVENYWKGVPIFFEFCQRKQAIARDQLICTTTTNRVIKFDSAMRALHIHVPSDEEKKNLWQYRDYMKKSKELKEADDPRWKEYLNLANSMWKNPDTGVRNAMDYSKFMGKIQRVSVNAPIQGLCGDFMRMSLNKIRQWVESDPLIATIFMLHCSVHDEIDFSVKNEYVPFVLPRITRIMKLRKLHQIMKWQVPIEADAEYGSSWDVEHHVTGDDDHIPAAWTKVSGMNKYLPGEWDSATIKNLINSISSQVEARVEKAKAFLKENLHERAFQAAWWCFNKKKGKKEVIPQTDPKEIQKALIAAIQLDEFWRIDNMPDDEDDKLETLEQYETRMGLGPSDRSPATLVFGPLGSLPLDAPVKRYVPEPLKVEISWNSPQEAPEEAEGTQGTLNLFVAAENPPVAPPDPIVTSPVGDSAPEVVPEPKGPPPGVTVYDISGADQLTLMQIDITLGRGDKAVWVLHDGVRMCLHDRAMDAVPERFLKKPA